jgi:hypothetical protein
MRPDPDPAKKVRTGLGVYVQYFNFFCTGVAKWAEISAAKLKKGAEKMLIGREYLGLNCDASGRIFVIAKLS